MEHVNGDLHDTLRLSAPLAKRPTAPAPVRGLMPFTQAAAITASVGRRAGARLSSTFQGQSPTLECARTRPDSKSRSTPRAERIRQSYAARLQKCKLGRCVLPTPTRGALLDHLICPLQQRLRDRQAKGLGDLQVVVNCSQTKGLSVLNVPGEVLKTISVASVRSQRHSGDCSRQRLGYPGERGSIGFR